MVGHSPKNIDLVTDPGQDTPSAVLKHFLDGVVKVNHSLHRPLTGVGTRPAYNRTSSQEGWDSSTSLATKSRS